MSQKEGGVASGVGMVFVNESASFGGGRLHMSWLWSKLRLLTSSAVLTTAQMWGKRKSEPVCAPVPRPMDEATPNPNHHRTCFPRCSAFENVAECGPSVKCATTRPARSNTEGMTKEMFAGSAAHLTGIMQVLETFFANKNNVLKGLRKRVMDFRSSVSSLASIASSKEIERLRIFLAGEPDVLSPLRLRPMSLAFLSSEVPKRSNTPASSNSESL
mmetsp:Transcript_40939/g.83764  ORF Transcript_40939/g.83764 Transcript_40939/m.83764 type:complete len:216 (-) Transcript_40939:274-921(-)